MTPFQSSPADARSEYFPNGSEGNRRNPSEQAWETARAKAAEEALNPWKVQNREEIRALCDPNLPDGAAALFCLIAKLTWIPDTGGFYKGRRGSICISARRLAEILHGGVSVKNFYSRAKKQKEKGEDGKWVWVTVGRTVGWINALVAGGYLWVSKHKVSNIPDDKSVNVYNLNCFVPQKFTPNLPWLDGNDGTVVHLGNSDLDLPNGNGNGESPINGTPSAPKREQPVPTEGNSPFHVGGTGNGKTWEQPVPTEGNSPFHVGGTGNGKTREQPMVKRGNGQGSGVGCTIKPEGDYSGDQPDQSPNRLGNRAKAAPLSARQRESENDFVAQCLELHGRKEMEENGAGWRFYFRANKAKAWACLHETRAMQKEQRIKTTTAKTMNDLWSKDRLNYDGKGAAK